MIVSTSHSGSSSMISGGGSIKLGPCSGVSLYLVRRDAWKTGCMFHVSDRSSLYATFDILAATLKGPYRLRDSFGDSDVRFKFLPSNQTRSPI